MTPLASRYFRSSASVVEKAVLSKSQFFECSSIYDMAKEMIAADVAAGCNEYSTFAQLPAPLTVIEFFQAGSRARAMVLAEQRDQLIEWMLFGEWEGEVRFLLGCSFTLGTGLNGSSDWDESFAQAWAKEAGLPHDSVMAREEAGRHAMGVSGVLEKMLCMINQPGLIERVERLTDKRVARELRRDASNAADAEKWFECRIKPGDHGETSAGGEASPRALHYVRKHFKPSVGKWIEGYWRGDIAYGIHQKYYNVQAPVGRKP